MDNRDVTIVGEAYGRKYSYVCRVEVWNPIEAVFVTVQSPREHRFVVSPRAHGNILGLSDCSDGTTTCNVTMDEVYNSIGYYKETNIAINITIGEM